MNESCEGGKGCASGESGGALGIELAVLGPFRVSIDGDDVTDRLPTAQRSILALLAAARVPVAKAELLRIVGLARSSIDPQLSKLRSALGAPRPVHRSRSPRAGFIALDTELVATDVDAFHERLTDGAQAHAEGLDGALGTLLAADELWRGHALDGVVLVDDPGCQTRVETLVDDLLSAKRRCRELASWRWLGGEREGLSGERLRGWAEDLGDSAVCWLAATTAVLERDGVDAAATVMDRWRERGSVDGDAGTTSLYASALRLLDSHRDEQDGDRAPEIRHLAGRVPQHIVEMIESAEIRRQAGEWDEAELAFAAAADEAHGRGDVVAEAEVVLAMARLIWDPSRFGGKLEDRVVRIVDDLEPGERLLRARLLACLAGGLYEDGSVDVERSETHAREALELVGELDDPLTAAEVLWRARKALIDVDPPSVQLERARRILSLAGSSDFHRCIGLMASIVDLLLLDRVDDARRDTESYREIAVRTRSTLHRYQVAALDGVWALYDRRFDDVGAATARAEALGGGFGGITVAQLVHAQRMWSAYERRDQARLRRMRPLLEAVASRPQPVPVWEIATALMAAVLGERDEARARLDKVAFATADLSTVPRGPLRIAALALAAMVCSDLATEGYDVRRTARGVHDQLVRHSAKGVLIGWPTIYLGPKQRFVEMAADATG